jgi:class 3 adenylate cyclase/predicted ATPase
LLDTLPNLDDHRFEDGCRTMDVGSWLRSLGLGQYEAAFKDNAVDAEVLFELNDSDLAQLGVLLGHRKRLLKAMAELASADKIAPRASLAPSTTAERRPITVMFCDLVGSTSLAAKLDAEDWRNLVNAYLDQASAAVTELGGHVLKKLGDGLMALFGYPHAQENDAERAVRAALAIQRALSDLNARNARSGAPRLSARIGIECGSVVVDAAGEVFGEAPNIAARVQAVAEPGSVIITASVQRQTAGLFVVEDKGAHDLKGVAAPVALYHVVRASGGGRRGGARALTPLVGREDELALLTRRWSRALEGEGQFVQIVGEPGIGKSRLVEEFRAKLAETPHTWVEWAASQLLQNTPLHPLAEWGRLRFGGADATDEGRLADLENTLRLVGLDPDEYAPLIAPLVDIALPEERSAKFAPEELRRRQFAAVTAWYFAGARTQPAVLVFEDLHWADPTSLDLLRSLAERGAQAPLLIVATARPEFRPPWATRSHHGVVSLASLDRAQVRRMVGEIASRHTLSDEMIDGVGERSGGVPLFVEEVTRLLLERNVQGGAQAIPPTLQQSLAARLDRLGAAREVAQVGAVLGRDFVYALLRDVAEIDEPTLQTSLDRLADADLLFVEGAPPQANYRFKHALIQDAAYESLLKSRRQALHRRAAEALLAADAEPEPIAHHFTQAGLDELAIEWWGKAGDQALRRSAFQEAISHLGRAIKMADVNASTRPAAREELSARLKLQTDYGHALMYSKGYAAVETQAAFTRATEFAADADHFSGRFVSEYGRWTGSFIRGEHLQAERIARELVHGAGGPEMASACFTLAASCLVEGKLSEAQCNFESVLATWSGALNDAQPIQIRVDHGVIATSYLALAAWQMGDLASARRLSEQAGHRAAEVANTQTTVLTHTLRVILEIWRSDPVATLHSAECLLQVAREHEMGLYSAVGKVVVIWARGRLPPPPADAADLRQAISDLIGLRCNLFRPLFLGLLAQSEAYQRNISIAITTIDEALALAEETGERWTDAFLHRIRGDLLARRDPADLAPAEDAYRTAIVIAKEQGARSYELLASLALAKLYQSSDRPAEAHAVLAPALEGFSPAPEMPEIAEAQALLTAVAETDAVKTDAARRERRAQLQLGMATALFHSRGMQAPETLAAFEKAGGTAAEIADPIERLAAVHGVWMGEFARGDVRRMQEIAPSAVALASLDATGRGAVVADRVLGVTRFMAGDLAAADESLRLAADHYEFDRDSGLAVPFGLDQGAASRYSRAFAQWMLGDGEAAGRLIAEAKSLAERVRHPPTSAAVFGLAAWLDNIRGDHEKALANAERSLALAREFGMPLWRANSDFWLAWSKAGLDGTHDAWDEVTAALDASRTFDVAISEPMTAYIAEGYAHLGDFGRALALVDRAFAGPAERGLSVFLPEAHRVRGDILFRRDPENPAAAERSLQAGIVIAREQGSRAFGLRASLALAKLYQSTARPADAHAVLAPTLEGFAPTPEMPEIAEAQVLLGALAETDNVKAQVAQRRRLTQLQVAYGNALFAARGFGAPEVTEAFARARESASGDIDTPDRLAVDYGLFAGSYNRGELPSMRALAAAFLSDVEARPDSPEAGIAHRVMGMTCWFAGEYQEGRDRIERALALFQPGRDDDLAFRFGLDPGVAAMAYLPIVSWPLGDADHAYSLVDRLHARIACVTHIGSRSWGTMLSALFDMMRADHARAAPKAFELTRLARVHELTMYRAVGAFLRGWVTDAGRGPGDGLEDMRCAVDELREQKVLIFDGLIKIKLAEAEARAGDPGRGLAILDEALMTCERSSGRAFEAELHRARGEMLLKQDPANPAPAGEAFLTAIAVAKQQSTRSFQLRAALSLAKLYQSTSRPADAHAVLAPALEGFSPTPGMPEIEEAEALLVAIEAGAHVRHE